MRMEARLDACDAKPMRTLSSYGSLRSRLCENARGPRMRRIVFSFAFFRHGLTVQLVSISTKSRLRFYTQVSCRTFHTAWFAGTTQDDCQLSNSSRQLTPSLPGIAVRRTASLPLAYARQSIFFENGLAKSDGCPGHLARRRASRFCPGMTSVDISTPDARLRARRAMRPSR
jgi:hypothetical protein